MIYKTVGPEVFKQKLLEGIENKIDEFIRSSTSDSDDVFVEIQSKSLDQWTIEYKTWISNKGRK